MKIQTHHYFHCSIPPHENARNDESADEPNDANDRNENETQKYLKKIKKHIRTTEVKEMDLNNYKMPSSPNGRKNGRKLISPNIVINDVRSKITCICF